MSRIAAEVAVKVAAPAYRRPAENLVLAAAALRSPSTSIKKRRACIEHAEEALRAMRVELGLVEPPKEHHL